MSEYDFSAPTTFQDAWKSDGEDSSDEDEVTDASFFGTRKSFILPNKPSGPGALAKAMGVVTAATDIGAKPGSPFFERTGAAKNNQNVAAAAPTTALSAKKAHKRAASFTLETLSEVAEATTAAVPESATAAVDTTDIPIATDDADDEEEEHQQEKQKDTVAVEEAAVGTAPVTEKTVDAAAVATEEAAATETAPAGTSSDADDETDLYRACSSSIPVWNPVGTETETAATAKKEEEFDAPEEDDDVDIPPPAYDADDNDCLSDDDDDEEQQQGRERSPAATTATATTTDDATASIASTTTTEEASAAPAPMSEVKPSVRFDEASIAKSSPTAKAAAPAAAAGSSSNVTARRSSVTSTPRRKVPGYLRGTAASASKRRSAERRSEAEDNKPANKMSRLTRSGARGLSASTKKASREEMRNKMREDAIRRATASGRKPSARKPSRSARKAPLSATVPTPTSSAARKLTQPVAFKFSQSRRRGASVDTGETADSHQHQRPVIAGINDPFSLGRAAAPSRARAAGSAYDASTLTRPKAFNLATASRAARKRAASASSSADAAAGGAADDGPVVFKSTKELISAFQNKTPARFHSRSRLDDKPELPEEFNPALTVPVAPKINMSALPSKAAGASDDHSPFVPLVNRVSSFHSKTPDRYKSEARLQSEGGADMQHHPAAEQPTLTHAMSPAFTSNVRAVRKPMPKSTEELQQEYIAQHAWKANPVNRAALHSTGDLGVPRIAKKACTEPQEFHLSSSNRAAAKAASSGDAAAFKAREVSKRMLLGPQFATLPSRKRLTETASPMLRTKMRAAHKPLPKSTAAADAEECAQQFKAAPAPKHILARAQTLPRPTANLGVTQPAEFHLASLRRHEQYQEAMRQKLEAEQAKAHAQAEFKAKPIQLEDKFVCKHVAERPLTEVREFHMPGQFFHAHAREAMDKKLQQEREQTHHAATFVARPAPRIARERGPPAKIHSTKPLTAAGSPGLATQARGERRRAFDERMRLKAEAEAEAKAEAEAAARAAEEEEIKALRKTMTFKAKPVMHEVPAGSSTGGKTRTVAPKPLTTPMTPNFATAKRALLRSLVDRKE